MSVVYLEKRPNLGKLKLITEFEQVKKTVISLSALY